MLSGRTTGDFITRVGRALEDAGRRGIHLSSGAGACDLEVRNFAERTTGEDGASEGGPEHLEGTPRAVDPGRPQGVSKLCYFLDGVQSTHEVGRIGAVPIIATTVAAAIANRCDRRFSRMPFDVPPTVLQAIILPLGVDEGVDGFHEWLVREGLRELYEDSPISE